MTDDSWDEVDAAPRARLRIAEVIRDVTPVGDAVLPIEAIIIGDGLRQDLGDIDELAESVRRFGLIQPLVVDGDNRLVAGERRLAAVQRLGWAAVPVRQYAALTPRERLDIAVEENERRKGLSEIERSRAIARMAHLARQVAAEEAHEAAASDELRVTMTRNSVGRPPTPGSLRDLEQRLHIDEATIRRAEQHVHAVAQYPELAPLPQFRVFSVANLLDELPAEDRRPWLEQIAATPNRGHESDLVRAIQETKAQNRRRRRVRETAPAAPPPAPTAAETEAEEEARARALLRSNYLRFQEVAVGYHVGNILQVRPRVIRQVLEPGDLEEARAFARKLLTWAEEWVEALKA
jgi:hypothetical protein